MALTAQPVQDSWEMSYFKRFLSADECAVIVQRGREPVLLRGPRSVRTFARWRRVITVDLRPFAVELGDNKVIANDDVQVMVNGQVQGRVVDPVAAAVKVVDYEDATRVIAQTAIRAVLKRRRRVTAWPLRRSWEQR
jgi:regulator of protease activity HflC (stomatin/prohibitin superfamily)